MAKTITFATGALAALTLTAAPTRADPAASEAAFTQALERFQAGDIKVARVDLLNALKENPKNGVARLLFARIQLARGNGVAAQTEIERAITAGIPRSKTYHLLANALLLQNQARQAIQMASNPTIEPPFASYAARMRGRAEIALANLPAAGRDFDEAVRLAPASPLALTDLARYQAGTNDIAGATRSIDRALAIAPNSVEVLLVKGSFVRVTQGLAQALPFYDRALETDVNSTEALLDRAQTLADLNRMDAARADIKRVLGLTPGQPIALFMSAVISARQGKFQEAQQEIDRTKGVLDRYPPAQMLRADLAMRQNNLGLAFEDLTAVLQAAPANGAARRMMAQVQLQRGNPRGALTTLEPLVKQPDLDAQTLAMLGSAHAQTGDFAGAQGFYQRAVKLAPNLTGLGTQIAMTRMAQGDAKGAVAGLTQALKADPKSLQALVSLTYVQLRQQDYRGSLATADRLVAAYPDNPLGYNLRGTAALGLGDAKRAEAEFRAATAKDPKFLDARRNLAQLFIQTNREVAGKRELQAIVATNPNDTRSLLLLADAAGRAKAWPERIDLLRRAITSNPQDVQPRAGLIQTYVLAGNPSQALTEADALARDQPKDFVALQILAAAQAANNKPAAAIATIKRIVDLAPQSTEAKVLLARAQAAQGATGLTDARATLENAIRQGGPRVDQAYIGLIQLELGAKNPDAALAAAQRLKLKAPPAQQLAADKLIGDVNMAAGRAPAALAAYERVRARVNNASSTTLVAGAQRAMGQPEVALKTLKDYHAQHPADVGGAEAMAEAYIARKDWRAAVDTYLSMRNTPAAANAGVLNNLAVAYGEIGDPRAVAAAARANQLAPNEPTVEDTYGWILVKRGADVKRGLTMLEAAAKGMPSDPGVRYHLGMAYKANGRKSDAARELKAAIATPGFADAAAARGALASVGG